MSESWIKLFRKFREWEWYQDSNVKDVFLEILLTANYEDKRWQGILIKRGQLVTSVNSLLVELNKNPKNPTISTRNIRTALNKLKSTNELTIETTTKYTLITVNKYEEYQQVTNKVTNDCQTSDKRLTTTKEYKNIRNKEINTYVSSFNEKFKSSYQVTSGRDNKLSLRLKKFTLEEILKALDNLSKSKFHQGDNDRGWKADPDFLIRSDEQVDKWLNVKPEQDTGDINSLLKL